MKPIKHQLQEGAIGDVIPHELLNRGKDYVNYAIGMMKVDHADKPGRYTHEDVRFATASACIDFEAVGPFKPGMRVIWADGFKVPPSFTLWDTQDHRYLDLKWEMESETPQIVSIGLGTTGTAPFWEPNPSGPGGNIYAWDHWEGPNDKPTEHRVRVLRWHRNPDSGRLTPNVDYYACFARIYLMVRQPLTRNLR